MQNEFLLNNSATTAAKFDHSWIKSDFLERVL